jgi:hypothetical protein
MVYFEKRATGNGLKMILGAAGSEDPVENAGIPVRSPRASQHLAVDHPSY